MHRAEGSLAVQSKVRRGRGGNLPSSLHKAQQCSHDATGGAREADTASMSPGLAHLSSRRRLVVETRFGHDPGTKSKIKMQSAGLAPLSMARNWRQRHANCVCGNQEGPRRE